MGSSCCFSSTINGSNKHWSVRQKRNKWMKKMNEMKKEKKEGKNEGEGKRGEVRNT